jgi:16S rRNA C967 or C1407 C5-methylase (RsmB/RsmF family)/NOL1/NOP2/fmu family ribosome biogenesis protein
MTLKSSYKLPGEFEIRMRKQLGDSAPLFFQSLHTDAPLSVRINPSKWIAPIQREQVAWCKTGYYLPVRPSFTLDPYLHGGVYYVQEPGSMLLEQAFNTIRKESPLLVLDLCGAPGGKSTHLLSLLSNEDMLVSNEVIRGRAMILQENIQKWGNSNVIVTNSDPRSFSNLTEMFDLVVADVPCSGEGLFRKDPLAIAEWSVNNTQLCASRQKRIISEAWECLKPGGHLIYSTCTFNPAENEENLQWLSEQKDAEPVLINTEINWGISQVGYRNIIGYQTFPHLNKAEGFFIGVLRKKGSSEKNYKQSKPTLKNWMASPAKVSGVLKDWIKYSGSEDFIQKGEEHYYLKANWQPVLSVLEKQLFVLQAGTPVASAKGEQLNPHHAVALANQLNRDIFPNTSLPLAGSIQYLQRENLHVPEAQNGWILVNYRGAPLGWLKNLGNRSNNYYPKEWRIRMNPKDIPIPWHEKSQTQV